MNRINKVLICIGILTIVFLLIYRYAVQKESHYTAQATVELLRNAPNEIQEVNTELKEVDTIETVPERSIFFINNCSDSLGIAIEQEKRLFEPHESGYLKLPDEQETTTLTIARKKENKAVIVYRTMILLSQERSETMTASEASDGNIRIRTVLTERPNQSMEEQPIQPPRD